MSRFFTLSISSPAFSLKADLCLVADPGALAGRLLFRNALTVLLVAIEIGSALTLLDIIMCAAGKDNEQKYHQQYSFHVPP
jgi:hypothetical protein